MIDHDVMMDDVMMMSTLKVSRYVFQLRNGIRSVAAILFQERQDVVLLLARVAGVERRQLLVDNPPRCILLRSVLNIRDAITTVERVMMACNVISSL